MPATSTTDKSVVLMVVGFLGAIALLGVLGLMMLINWEAPPEALTPVVAIVSAAAGSLGTLLASSKTTNTVTAEAEAVGYNKAVDQVEGLAHTNTAAIDIGHADVDIADADDQVDDMDLAPAAKPRVALRRK